MLRSWPTSSGVRFRRQLSTEVTCALEFLLSHANWRRLSAYQQEQFCTVCRFCSFNTSVTLISHCFYVMMLRLCSLLESNYFTPSKKCHTLTLVHLEINLLCSGLCGASILHGDLAVINQCSTNGCGSWVFIFVKTLQMKTIEAHQGWYTP